MLNPSRTLAAAALALATTVIVAPGPANPRELRLGHRRGQLLEVARPAREQAVLGVPFYSRPTYYTYSQLVAMDPANANRDCTTVSGVQQCYNGIPTITRKTQWAMANAGGMMNWELSQDTTGSTSLVTAIFDTVMGGPPPPTGRVGQITGIAGKCVDVAGANAANGTAVQLWTCNGTNAQRWSIASNGTIQALGKCMDVTGGGTANGTKVQLWDCNGTGAQVWQAQSNRTLRNPQSGRCLDATGPSSADGTRLQIWDCFGGSNQQWTLPVISDVGLPPDQVAKT